MGYIPRLPKYVEYINSSMRELRSEVTYDSSDGSFLIVARNNHGNTYKGRELAGSIDPFHREML